MKKTILFAAVSTVLVSGSAMSATVYKDDSTSLSIGGRLEFRGDFNASDSGEEIEGTMKNKSRARLNIKAETELSSELKGFGFWESEQTVKSSGDGSKNDNDDFNQRYMYVGIKGDFGSVSFGRQDTAGVQISAMSDIATFTGGQKSFINSGNEQINNTFVYAYDMDSVKFKASYIAGDDEDTDGYGASVIYMTPFGLNIALGYSANDNGVGLGSADQVISGLSYTFEDLYLGATYTTGDLDDDADEDFDGVEIAVRYHFTNEFSVTGVYQKQEKVDEDSSDFSEFTGTYDFNKNFRSYVSYKLNNLEDEETNYAGDAEDTIRLGLRYVF